MKIQFIFNIFTKFQNCIGGYSVMSRINKLTFILVLVFSSYSLTANYGPVKVPIPKENIKSVKPAGYNGSASAKATEYYNIATQSAMQGNMNYAIQSYKSAIAEDSLFVEAYDNLGRTFRLNNQIDSAIHYYKKSLQIYPEGTIANQNIGVAYMTMEDYDGAIESYERVIKIYPDSAEGYYGLAQVYVVTFKYKDALSFIDKAIEIYAKNESEVISDGYLMKAIIYSGMEDKINTKKYLILAKEHGATLDSQMESLINTELDEVLTDDEMTEEEKMMTGINWYLRAPVEKDNEEKRKAVAQILMQWIIESPDVTVLIDTQYIPAGCGECLLVFTFAWAKYTLQNDGQDDVLGACFFAVTTTTGFYLNNKEALGENKELDRLIEMEVEGKLKERLKEIIAENEKKKSEKKKM